MSSPIKNELQDNSYVIISSIALSPREIYAKMGKVLAKYKKCSDQVKYGDIAQLARAPALQAGGPGFESLCLHQYEG